MKRLGLGGIVLAMAIVLTACPTLPPGYQAPYVESHEISPEPVGPGETVTISIVARDDEQVTSLHSRYFITPALTYVSVESQNLCPATRTPIEGQTKVLFTVSCAVPEFANNGTWWLEFSINDNSYPNTNYPVVIQRIPFEVTGGSDDRTPPELVSFTTSPAVIDQGTTFRMTARVRDISQPIAVGQYGTNPYFWFGKAFSPHSRFACSSFGHTVTQVAPDLADVSFTCTPEYYSQPGAVEAGAYRASPLFRDALNHPVNLSLGFDVVPLPG